MRGYADMQIFTNSLYEMWICIGINWYVKQLLQIYFTIIRINIFYAYI